MGLGNLFHARAAKSNPSRELHITDSSGGLFGDDYQRGMSLPGAWRASILISDIIGQLPFHAYRYRSGKTEKLDPTPILLTSPTPGDTAITTFSSMALDLLWHGNSICVVADRSPDGLPTALYPVPADLVHVRWFDGQLEYRIGRETYTPYDVLHIKGPTRPGALRGMGVLENHLNKLLTLADEQATQARNLGTHGVPSGVLKSSDPGLDEHGARELKKIWVAGQSSRTVGVLNATTEYQAVGWNPEQTQLLEARKFSLHEIALVFGLDPSWLGVTGASMTYTNLEQESVNLLKFSLGGHVSRFEQALTSCLPSGDWVKANTDALLRSDTLNRYQAHQIGIDAGFLTIAEARALEDLPALESANAS